MIYLLWIHSPPWQDARQLLLGSAVISATRLCRLAERRVIKQDKGDDDHVWGELLHEARVSVYADFTRRHLGCNARLTRLKEG